MTAKQKVLIVCLSLIFAGLSFSSALRCSATYDEPLAILAGVAAWQTGQNNIDYSNPPLSHYWQALPLLSLKLGPLPPSKILAAHPYRLSYFFLYGGRYPADTLLNRARLMSGVLAVLLGLAMTAWCSRALGSRAALAAMTAFAFCPVLIAHGALVKADIAGALGTILTLWAMWIWAEQPASSLRATVSGLAAGTALCSKYSAVLVLIVGGWNYISVLCRMQRRPSLKQLLMVIVIFGFAVNLVMAISYRGSGFPQWLVGVHQLSEELRHHGYSTYLLGQRSLSGFRSYFVWAFLLKTPVPFLALSAVGLLLSVIGKAEQALFCRRWLWWPSLLVTAVSSFSPVQLGIRHILPIYPLLCMSIGYVVSRWLELGSRAAKIGLAVLGVVYISESCIVFPKYLSYFNVAVGGSANRSRFLADSNLDWGQGMKALGRFLKQQGSPPIYLSYFGCADPAAYGIRYRPVRMTMCVNEGGMPELPSNTSPTLFAISANNRVGAYYDRPDYFRWLNTLKPLTILLDSIWIYDLTGNLEAQSILRSSPPA